MHRRTLEAYTVVPEAGAVTRDGPRHGISTVEPPDPGKFERHLADDHSMARFVRQKGLAMSAPLRSLGHARKTASGAELR